MKKIISIFVSILLIIGIFSVVPASAETYTEIDCPKLTKIADLDQKVNEGTASGIFIESLKAETSSDVYKLVIPEDCYLVTQYGGKVRECGESQFFDRLTAKLSFYSDINLTKLVFDKKIDKDDSAYLTTMDKINKGTYYVQFSRYDGSLPAGIVSLFAYFGYLPLNTQFLSLDFVKAENNGKNVTLKLNSLDLPDTIKYRLAKDDYDGINGAEWTINYYGTNATLDKDSNFNISLNENNSQDCYIHLYVKDVYGYKYFVKYLIMTDLTAKVNIPNVEYTGKSINPKLSLTVGTDSNSLCTYNVQCQNNINIGIAKVKIVGTNQCLGELNKTFKIVHTKHNDVTKITKKPTYFNEGIKSITCSVCGKISTSTVAKLKLKVPSFAVKGAKKQIKVNYKQVSDATGYQIKYKIGKKTVVKTYKSAKAATRKINKLKKGKYKIQVRSMIVTGNLKAYSNWSKVKIAKIK